LSRTLLPMQTNAWSELASVNNSPGMSFRGKWTDVITTWEAPSLWRCWIVSWASFSVSILVSAKALICH
jgi:hypothetical protein